MVGRLFSRAVVAVCALGAVAGTARAKSDQPQSDRDLARQLVEANDLGRALQTLSIFGGAPGISAATYYGDMDLNAYKVPVARTLEPFTASGAFAGVSPYVELTAGYLGASQHFGLPPSPGEPTGLKVDYDSWTGLAGAGLEIPLGESVKLRPVLLAGYSHISGGIALQGPGQAEFRDITRGILADSSIDSVMLGGALEAVYETRMDGDVRFKAKLRYNEIQDIAVGASDRSLRSSGAFGAATGGAEFNGPTDWQIAAYPLRWLAFANATWLDTPGDLFGFNSFAELGGGLQLLAPDVVNGVEGVTVRSSAILGDGVTGWSLGVSLAF
ncbi:MAG TPA: hypothetical protein VL899_02695 [Alphaproteobacteria bacterium]|jgi:hypothetical protein|nr:hypothetical protein [Alphaproteobacteria bacterium]